MSFPETVRGTTGGDEVPVSGLCGAAWLGGDRYVAAQRQGGDLIAFRMRLDNGDKPRAVLELLAVPGGGTSSRTDVAFDTIQQRMLVVDDSPPAMPAIRIDDANASESFDTPAVQCAARCHSALQNQPLIGASKPATMWGVLDGRILLFGPVGKGS